MIGWLRLRVRVRAWRSKLKHAHHPIRKKRGACKLSAPPHNSVFMMRRPLRYTPGVFTHFRSNLPLPCPKSRMWKGEGTIYKGLSLPILTPSFQNLYKLNAYYAIALRVAWYAAKSALYPFLLIIHLIYSPDLALHSRSCFLSSFHAQALPHPCMRMCLFGNAKQHM